MMNILGAIPRPVAQCLRCAERRTYFTRRTKLPIPDVKRGTYNDILKLHERIDACVTERDQLREKTLPLQVQDNRLRALYHEENWKLREFDEWTARQDPNWQPPPALPHGRKKRNRRLREMAKAEAAIKRAERLANKAATSSEAGLDSLNTEGYATSQNGPERNMKPKLQPHSDKARQEHSTSRPDAS